MDQLATATIRVTLMPFRFLAWIFLLTSMIAPTLAETCKYVDADGHIIYSNNPRNPPKGTTKVKCFDDPTPKPAQAAKPARNSDENAKEGFPRVDEPTQRKRDDDRRRILDQELAEEQKRLAEARAKLAEAESVREGGERNYTKVLERLKPFKDAVAAHERNIESLKREISTQK
ncbi:MAG: DUF4124 domain-containing protein [Burkholderiales bacterium]